MGINLDREYVKRCASAVKELEKLQEENAALKAALILFQKEQLNFQEEINFLQTELDPFQEDLE